MKSLKLIAVAAIFGAIFMSCEAESLNDDQQQLEEVEVLSGTGDKVDVPVNPDDD